MATLYQDAVSASASGNVARVASDTDQMNTIANQAVMYLWTQYPEYFYAITSNVQGFYWSAVWGVNGPWFALLSPTTVTSTTTSAAAAPSSNLTLVAGVIVVIVIIAIAALVARGRKKTKS